jgi:hypothetical protein
MTNKMFVHYDETGKIVSFTNEHEIFMKKRIEDGEKLIEVDHQFDYKAYKVDLSTMEIIPKTPEEIEAELPPPIQIPVTVLMAPPEGQTP